MSTFGSLNIHFPSTTFCWFPPLRASTEVPGDGALTFNRAQMLFFPFYFSGKCKDKFLSISLKQK
jgi:hypothetical protein